MADQPVLPDRYLKWEHLLLLLTPFPVALICRLGFIFGFDDDAVARIAGAWVEPMFLLSLGTLFVLPIGVIGTLVVLVGRHVYFRRWRPLAMYGVVLVVMPIALKLLDGDYLRFLLQKQYYNAEVARLGDPLPAHSAHCFVFDRVSDHFYLGGASFDPFVTMILYVSADVAGEDFPHISTFVSGDCPSAGELQHIRPLTGRFYLATTGR